MIRLIIAAIFAVLAIILCLPIHLYFWILSKSDKYKSWYKSWRFVRGFFKTVLFIAGTKTDIKGLENLAEVPKDKGILFIGNHRSYFDILILQSIIDRPMGFIAKKEFKKVPFFSWWVADLGSLFLDRKNVRAGLETMKVGAGYMKQGLSLGLYPEGTRNHEKELLPFKKGGYRMAEESECPIVLVTMKDVDNIFENNHPVGLKKQKIKIAFSKPIYPHEMDRNERKAAYDEFPVIIQKTLDEFEA
ncbi:MAG: 1-acyl-sn-glycerol-3-phosphate acyltransferase [Eubacterium sp.]|nr:1-acyl-sn-glycerol-3-phosphate acyltransferase [Eubacterium sp.]